MARLEADPMHPASLPEDELLKACNLTFTRGSGPGGQHRNKVQTKAVLTHRPTGITAQAGERRSQAANRIAAVHRLRVALAVAVRTQRDEPSALWKSRRRGRAIPVNPKHADFPALLAEAMDAVAGTDDDVAAAAKAMGVSTSQMVKLLKAAPEAIQRVNANRATRERGAMR